MTFINKDLVSHFDRFEFKYILNAKLRQEFESELINFMDLDPYVVSTESQKYFVRSLYFDNDQFSCFFDKVDGIKKRHKFRVRTYTNRPCSQVPQFLEIKGRFNQFVFKHRIELPFEEQPICSRLTAQQVNNTVIQQFNYEYFKKQIRPQCIIDYWRRPYVSKYDPNFRLTFDEQLSATLANELIAHPHSRTRELLSGYAVMEIKFKRQIPAWFHSLIQVFDLERTSISKICQGLDTLNIVKDI